MNKIKSKIKLIILLIFILITMILACYKYISIAANSGEFTYTDDNGNIVVIPYEIVLPYAFKYTEYDPINYFPVDKFVFNSSEDYFCVQHRTAYASLDREVQISDKYHKHYTVAYHNLFEANRGTQVSPFGNGKIYTTVMTADGYPTNQTSRFILSVVLGENALLLDNKLALAGQIGILKGFREATEAYASDMAYTNFCYRPEETTFDCEGDESEFKNSNSHFSDGAMAFLVATYKNPGRSSYSSDPLQRAIWHWRDELGGGESNPLYSMAKKYDKYHEESKEPNIDILPDDNVGSKLTSDSSGLDVGPFTISDYITASNYEVDGVFDFDSFDTDTTNPADIPDTPELEDMDSITVDESLQDKFGDDHIGGIIEMYAILTNEDGTTSAPMLVMDAIPNNSIPDVPQPQSIDENDGNFNVQLPASVLSQYDELDKIVCRYQRVHACANGMIYRGQQHTIPFQEIEGSENSTGTYSNYEYNQEDSRYQCTVCDQGKTTDWNYPQRINFEDRSDAGGVHTWDCGVDKCKYCEHGYTADHYACHSPDSFERKYCRCTGELNAGEVFWWVEDECDCDLDADNDGVDELTCEIEHKHQESKFTKHEHVWECKCKICPKSHCSHGHSTGDHSKECKSGTGDFSCNGIHENECTGKTICRHDDMGTSIGCSEDATHNHTTCIRVDWDLVEAWVKSSDFAQDAMSIAGSLVNEQIDYTITVNVPLVTDLSIYKYITKVTHQGNGNVEQNLGDSRREMTPEEKEDDPVPVEVGDLVDYTIELHNNERFPVKAMIEDILPADCEFISCTSESTSNVDGEEVDSGTVVEISGGIQTAQTWIPIEGNSSTYVYLQLIPLNESAIQTLYTNTAKITTGNFTDPTVETGEWGDGSTHGPRPGGPIVNGSDKTEDSDTYIVKAYNVGATKYIYNVNHNKDSEVTSTLDTSYVESEARKEMSEAQKEESPVYVEYGDIVTYKIVLENTIEGRSASPYYEPDEVYVDIVDTLPKKYSNLVVEIDGTDTSHTITSQASSNTGGELKIESLMVPAGGTRTVTVKLVVEEHTKATVEENNVVISKVKNVNRGPGQGLTTEDKYCLIYDENQELPFNLSEKLDTSDYYKLNDYNVTVEKYLFAYDEKIQKENDTNGYSNEVSVSNADGTLKVSRKDKAEEFKKNNPLSVEKGETIKYAIIVSNNATTAGTKPATQVRPTVTEKLELGLRLVNTTAGVYSGDTKVANATPTPNLIDTITEDGRNYAVYEITVGRETIIDPGQYLKIEVEVEIIESNMYLYDLRNSATLGKLENINVIGTTVPEPQDGTGTGTPREVKNDTYDENIAPDADKESSDYVRMKDLVIAGQVWLDIDKDGFMNDQARSQNEINNYKINQNAMKEGIKVHLYQVGKTDPVRTTYTDSNGLYTFGKNDAMGWNATQYTYTDTGNTYSSGAVYQRVNKADVKDANGNYMASSRVLQYYVEFEYDGVLYRSTRIYSGDVHLNDDGSYGDNYLIDSNAAEFEDVRADFNNKHEYISYNISYDLGMGNPADLEFNKNNHVSELIEDASRVMTSRSFIDATKQSTATDSTKYLWLYDFGGAGNNTLPETEYLKHINLGIELREDVDITLSKDVFKIKTTVNGDEMEYKFNANGGINGEANGTQPSDNYIINEAYDIELYESDYKYRIEQYLAKAVRDYKGKESELNIEVTYKINIHNKSVTDDDLVGGALDTKLNVQIHEIVDLYDANFIEYKDDPNETITAKLKNADGFLEDKTIRVAQAWLGSEIPEDGLELTLSNSSDYLPDSKDNNFAEYGYRTLYIKGMDGISIPEGGSIDVYVKYVIDKEASTITNTNIGGTETIERALKIAERTAKPNGRFIENIAQINAYSVWYEDGRPASLVDMDSNVGNIGTDNGGNKVSVDEVTYYEDTAYKTGVNITARGTENPPDSPPGPEPDPPGPEPDPPAPTPEPDIPEESNIVRKINGKVWDDAKNVTETNAGVNQYVGNGEYNDSDIVSDDSEVKLNENVDKNYKNPAVPSTQDADAERVEEKDIAVRSAKAEFVEIIKLPAGGETRYYEEILQNVTWTCKQFDRTSETGEYLLQGFIPGMYIVRYTYGDSLESDIANYDPNDIQQKDMIIFNGQDYKSTKYNFAMDEATTMDAIIEALEVANLSDARDDEIRRLQVNSYSEVMNNEIAEVLKGSANGTVDVIAERTEVNTAEQFKTLTDNTAMNAETVEFLVRPEKISTTGYTELKMIDNTLVEYSEREFIIPNIDFGLEYRAESGISLTKEIDEIKITTESGEVLVDLFFYTVNTGDENQPILHYIDEERSKGDELTQFISNNYEYLRSGLTTEDIQGFVYIQVDTDLLQGSTVEIVYKFTALNDSEIDRISTNLNDIRYKENNTTKAEILKYNNKLVIDTKVPHATLGTPNDQNSILDTEYTASGTASNIMLAEYYGRDTDAEGGDGSIYRRAIKEMDTYFGKYVGESYYTRNIATTTDMISSLKFDKILDYIDTDLVYIDDALTLNSENREWDILSGDVSQNLGLVGSSSNGNAAQDMSKFIQKLRIVDNAGNLVNTKLTNPKGILYTLAISVDDRISDQEDDGNIINDSLSRFLFPDDADGGDDSKSRGYIYLPVSKVVSAESDTREMLYENIAEVIQFTTLTGRRTNFDTTIGNADLDDAVHADSDGSEEFKTSSLEADTGATETITLTPPTGLDRTRRKIVNVVNSAKNGISIAAIALAVVIIVFVVTNVIVIKARKRRIR